jgi:hypothetical protein
MKKRKRKRKILTHLIPLRSPETLSSSQHTAAPLKAAAAVRIETPSSVAAADVHRIAATDVHRGCRCPPHTNLVPHLWRSRADEAQDRRCGLQGSVPAQIRRACSSVRSDPAVPAPTPAPTLAPPR